ncbi:riboflavin synthase domain-like protein [Cutaneotrichosporon oleaginosum]|uniref:Riboflavin synthase domain-like protein n=1 Tax=Cutaneotrichosporon oleaginosum TaxID=879819 RepID=A0A0J1BDJ4_9TREE|nr:riboflavin synthase domain-like protein [Cutaneotrichosporon oleaginosum]KLT46134.1 riboflavin synthase domain-like protein [Cutaneotrichosporon oleaginosum]TXT10144.1 hypothetical protein COLE_04078 [Cutaneotrichosporon oleaginosum]
MTASAAETSAQHFSHDNHHHSPSPTSDTGEPQHVLILYASETGDAQDVAERVARAFRAHHRRAITMSMDAYDIADLPHEPLLILITSTHGRGEPPPAMRGLWSKLIRAGLPSHILEDVHYSLYGLGDSSYERFCFAGKMLARRMESLGAQSLVEPAWGDERAPDGIEETLLPWLERTLAAIVPYLPGPSCAPRPDTELPPPIYRLEPVEDADVAKALDRLHLASADPSDSKAEYTDIPPADSRNGSEANGITESARAMVYHPAGWQWATLSRNKRVTAPDWWQDVREVELELVPGVTYPPGAICALQPRCSDEEVDTFLECNRLEAEADRVFVIRSTVPGQPLPAHLPSGATTLRTLLTHHLDLRCPPRKSFFEWLRRLSTDEREQERLDEFITDPDEIHDYATRPKRSILETLADFRETTIPMSHVLEILGPLRRRQFSIASDSGAHPGKIQLLIALVDYKTNLKIPRIGLCSSWLVTLPEGTRIPYTLLSPTLHLPADDVPVILVGPGTGVAPMRAFLEARLRRGAAKDTALYFGFRSRTADLYFADDWAEAEAKGALVRLAASRDGKDKVYVQDLIRQDATMINDWVTKRDAHVFVCGSSNAMPRAVREAIAWCISSEGAGTLSVTEAEAYVDAMFDGDRGGEESW